MEITPGVIMLITGAIGSAICFALLLVIGGVFRKQRKKLLENIQEI